MSHLCEAVPLAAELCRPLRWLGAVSSETKISQRHKLRGVVWLATTHWHLHLPVPHCMFSGLHV